MNTFGPAIATYRGNRIVIGLFVVLAVTCCALVWMSLHATEANSPGDYRIYVAGAILTTAVAFWTSRKTVSLHSEAVVYQNLSGEKQMKWSEVEKFYYSATKRSVNFIPIGTYYSYKLVDAQGHKITLGNGIEHPKDLGLQLIRLTQEPLLKKTSQQFNSGAEVDFGHVKLNHSSGMTIRKLLGGWKTIPLSEMRGYSLQLGQFCVWGDNNKLLGAAGVPKIPNLFVLQALLDIILQPKAQGAHAG